MLDAKIYAEISAAERAFDDLTPVRPAILTTRTIPS